VTPGHIVGDLGAGAIRVSTYPGN